MNEDRASRYHRLKRRATALSLGGSAALLVALLASGASAWLREASVRLAGAAAPAAVALFALWLALISEAIALPLAFYRGFLLERRYGLSREPASAWLKDHAKASALGIVLGVAAANVIYGAIAVTPRAWWLLAAVVFTLGFAFLTRIMPTLLLPMFYRFTPLARDALRDRLQALSHRAGVPVLGVYEWGLGAKTRRANAALVGSGATRRILLSDTLLADYTDDEIEVILAHELAHHVHHDIPKALVAEFVLLLAGLAAAAAALERWGASIGLTGPGDVAGFPLVVLAAGTAMIVATPVLNGLSRLNERRADRYALRLTGRHDAFVSAMRRLGEQNLAEPRPSRLALWFFHTHPPIAERIEAARIANP